MLARLAALRLGVATLPWLFNSPLSAQTLQPTSEVQFIAPTVVPVLSSVNNLAALQTQPQVNGTSIAAIVAAKAVDTATARRIPDLSGALVRSLRGNSSGILTELKSLGTHLEMVKAAASNGDTTAQQTLLAAFMLDDASVNQLADLLGKVDRQAADRFASDASEVRRLLNRPGTHAVTAKLLAQGAVRSGLSGSEDAGKAATGSIGLGLNDGRWQLTGLVTVASSVDTLRTAFGSFLLTPASGQKSLSTFLVDLYTPPLSGLSSKLGSSKLWPAAHVYVTGANSVWERRVVSGAGDTARTYKQAAVLGLGGLLNWQIKRGRLLNVPVQMNVETGYSRRYLRGDVFADSAFIRGTLQSPGDRVRRSWGVWESGFQMGIGAVTAGVQYYWIDGNVDRDFISGLTNGQLVIGIAVSGDVVSGVLSD